MALSHRCGRMMNLPVTVRSCSSQGACGPKVTSEEDLFSAHRLPLVAPLFLAQKPWDQISTVFV
jgi:hypothetical protein